MKTHRKIIFRLLFVLFLLFVGVVSPTAAGSGAQPGVAPADIGVSPAEIGVAPTEIGERARRFASALNRQGFEVSAGEFMLYTIADCPYSFAVMGTCYFNNPAAPYVIPVLPLWPGEYVDPATAGAFGPTSAGFSVNHRLDPREAIVILGVLPPPARYFGMQSYLFTRTGSYQTDNDTYRFLEQAGVTDLFFHTVPGNPARISTWDSLSNSNNNVVIERQSGAAFGQLRYFIITPDRIMDRAVRQILNKLSVDAEDIFSEAIPSNMKLGLDKDADEFLTLIRYAMPDDGGGEGSASDAWRRNPPLVVLRIRDTRPYRQPQPYPAWLDDSPETRTAQDEAWLHGSLGDLVTAVRERWAQPCNPADGCTEPALPFIDTQSYPFNLVGPKCDNIGMDCLGDTQDATYQFRGGWTFDNGEVYAVVGTLGTLTGNATYVSLGVNLVSLRLGVANISDLLLQESAAAYPGVANREKLYVYYITRDCAGLEALTDPLEQSDTAYCVSISEDMIPAGEIASFVERDYVKAGSQRGPESTLTLPSMVIKLQRPAP